MQSTEETSAERSSYLASTGAEPPFEALLLYQWNIQRIPDDTPRHPIGRIYLYFFSLLDLFRRY